MDRKIIYNSWVVILKIIYTIVSSYYENYLYGCE